jgi:hypothetical protein
LTILAKIVSQAVLLVQEETKVSALLVVLITLLCLLIALVSSTHALIQTNTSFTQQILVEVVILRARLALMAQLLNATHAHQEDT